MKTLNLSNRNESHDYIDSDNYLKLLFIIEKIQNGGATAVRTQLLHLRRGTPRSLQLTKINELNFLIKVTLSASNDLVYTKKKTIYITILMYI